VDDIQQEMQKIITIQEVREDHGKMKVLAIFRTGKKDMIVGGRITKGKLIKGDELEVLRGEEVIGKGKLSQMKKGKDEVGDCAEGEECGITFDADGTLPKIQAGDEIYSYVMTQKALSEIPK